MVEVTKQVAANGDRVRLPVSLLLSLCLCLWPWLSDPLFLSFCASQGVLFTELVEKIGNRKPARRLDAARQAPPLSLPLVTVSLSEPGQAMFLSQVTCL